MHCSEREKLHYNVCNPRDHRGHITMWPCDVVVYVTKALHLLLS